MSCFSNKKELEVSYNNIKHSKPGGINSYFQLLQFIYTKYSSLRSFALTLYYKSEPISPPNYYSLFSSIPQLEITVEKSAPIHSPNLSIFKLRLEDSDILCTGFLFTYIHGVIPSEYSSSEYLPKLRLLFEDETEISLNESCTVMNLDYNLSIIELPYSYTIYQPILFDTETPLTLSQTYAYFFLKYYPLLEKKPLEVLNFSPSDFSIEVEEGAVGAPVVSHENKLLGVVNSLNTVVPVRELVKSFPNSITLPDGFDLARERSPAYFYPTACFFDSQTGTAGFYSPEEAVNKVFSFRGLISGSTATCTFFGIVFVGIESNMEAGAYLYNEGQVEKLPNPLKRHLFHCAVYFNDLLYVIGGSSSAVESFNFRENCWKSVKSLNKRRSFASATVSGDHIFVFGGKRDDKWLKSILKFKRKWVKIQVKLEVGLACCGVIGKETEFLVFGGHSEEGANLESWKVSIGEVVEKKEYQVGFNFGRFEAVGFRDEVICYANSCEMIKYDRDSDEIYKVILDEESV